MYIAEYYNGVCHGRDAPGHGRADVGVEDFSNLNRGKILFAVIFSGENQGILRDIQKNLGIGRVFRIVFQKNLSILYSFDCDFICGSGYPDGRVLRYRRILRRCSALIRRIRRGHGGSLGHKPDLIGRGLSWNAHGHDGVAHQDRVSGHQPGRGKGFRPVQGKDGGVRGEVQDQILICGNAQISVLIGADVRDGPIGGNGGIFRNLAEEGEGVRHGGKASGHYRAYVRVNSVADRKVGEGLFAAVCGGED